MLAALDRLDNVGLWAVNGLATIIAASAAPGVSHGRPAIHNFSESLKNCGLIYFTPMLALLQSLTARKSLLSVTSAFEVRSLRRIDDQRKSVELTGVIKRHNCHSLPIRRM